MMTRPRAAAWFLILLSALPGSLGAAETLVPARFRSMNDSKGFLWDVNPMGAINDGTNDCFDNGAMLMINGQQFRAGRPQMTADGSEYVLAGGMGGINVTRRIRLDAKAGAMRYVEVLQSAQPATVTLMLTSQLGSPAQTILSERGTPGGTLGARDGALVAYQMSQQQRPSVVFAVCDPRSRVKPQFSSNQPNHDFTFNYSVNLQPNKPVAVVHALLQRNFTSPPDAKVIADQLRPLWARDFLKDLPPELRAAVVNWSRPDSDQSNGFPSLAVEMGFDVEAVDVLAMGNTRLRGSLACDALSIEGRFGKRPLAVEQVAAIQGERSTRGSARVLLRDGQSITGSIEARGLRFSLNNGLEVGLESRSLDRVLLRAATPDEEGAPKQEAGGLLIETMDQNRLLVKPGSQAGDSAAPSPLDPPKGTAAPSPLGPPGGTLTALTAWGTVPLPLEEIESLRFSAENPPAREVRLRDGSRFFAQLAAGTIRVETQLFGPLSLDVSEIRSIAAVARSRDEDAPATPGAQVVLTEAQKLLGRIEAPELRFVCGLEEVPVPPDQVRVLRRGPAPRGEEALAPLAAAVGATPIFQAELWDGGVVIGPLRQTTLPVRVGGALCQVPVADLLEANTTAPVLPERLRDRVVELVRKLGHESFAEREKAQKELQGIGAIARGIVADAADQSKDAEVRRRAKAILKEFRDEPSGD